MIRENLIVLIDFYGSSERKRFSEFAEKTGINRDTLKQIYHGNQKLNNEQLDQISSAFPEYRFWMISGETMPTAGQISPKLEETAVKLKETGTDT